MAAGPALYACWAAILAFASINPTSAAMYKNAIVPARDFKNKQLWQNVE
jgi:hypothetical protein